MFSDSDDDEVVPAKATATAAANKAPAAKGSVAKPAGAGLFDDEEDEVPPGA